MATFIGTDLDDFIDTGYGTNDDFISTGAGNDIVLNQAHGNDTLIGGTGNDDIYCEGYGTKTYIFSIGDGADTVRNYDDDGYSDEDAFKFTNVGIGDVALSYDAGDLLIDYGSGDQITVRVYFSQPFGLSFADGIAVGNVIFGTGANDDLLGEYDFGRSSTEGNDLIDGLAGADTMAGWTGDDVLFVDNAGDVVEESAGEGTDTVVSSIDYTLGANVENLTLRGAAALNGTGNGVANILTGNRAVNTLTGGAGNDTYVVQNTADLVVENSGEGTDRVKSTATYLLSANVENLTLTGTSAINGTGNGLANVLTGNSAANVINGSTGTDTMIGGDGSDRYYVDNAGDVVTESNATASTGGTDTVYSYLAAYTLGANVENGRILAAGAANLSGNSLNNTLYAGAGNNVLDGGSGLDTAGYHYAGSAVTVSLALTTGQATGGSGTDTLTALENLTGSAYNDTLTGNIGNNVLNGGLGADSMYGGLGNDTYYVDNAADVIGESSDVASGGLDTVASTVTRTLGNYQENLTLSGAAAINGYGNSLANKLVGNSANNVLNGGLGADSMYGGLGNDTYYVDNAADVVSESSDVASGGLDTVVSTVTRTLGSYQENLTLSGAAAINGYGNSLANKLVGNSANNVLTGGGGKDALTGGAGNDIFDFNALSEMGLTSTTWDVISDFVRGADKIDLSTLDANSATAGNDAFTTFLASSDAFTAAGQLKFAGGVLYGNTDADASAEFAIALTGISTLSSSDLVM